MGPQAAPASVTLNPQVIGNHLVITEAELSNSGGLQSAHTARPSLGASFQEKGGSPLLLPPLALEALP